MLFFTDGVTEALNEEEHFYTTDRLQMILGTLGQEPVERITRAIVRDVRAFCGTHEQADDLTLLAVRWNGVNAGAAAADDFVLNANGAPALHERGASFSRS